MNLRAALISIVLAFIFAAQTEELELRLTRDWGYGGFDNSIQGRFSMHASGPEGLVEVRFEIDGAVVNVDTEAPFRYQFDTGSFAPGEHTLSASGLLADGREIRSAGVVRNFLSAEQAGELTNNLIFPLLAVVGGIMAIGVIGPLLFSRKRKHKPGVYGMAGGAVCRRCRMPFSRSMLAPNLLTGKLERCPHCGKWSIAARAGAEALAEAEARLASEGAGDIAQVESEEEKKNRLLDESRFDG